MDLYTLFDKKVNAIQEKKNRRENELKIKEDKENMNKEFSDAWETVAALQAYKYFIENIYEEFIKSMVSVSGEDMLEDNTTKGLIRIFSIEDYRPRADGDKTPKGIDGLISYTLNHDVLDLYVANPFYFKAVFDNYASKNRITKHKSCLYYLDIPMKKIVDSYYSEIQAVPVLEEQIQQIAEDYNIDLEIFEETKPVK